VFQKRDEPERLTLEQVLSWDSQYCVSGGVIAAATSPALASNASVGGGGATGRAGGTGVRQPMALGPGRRGPIQMSIRAIARAVWRE
jgi:hypothetical protein